MSKVKHVAKKFINQILCAFSLNLVSAQAPKNYVATRREIDRLRRNCSLLATALIRLESASVFERKWIWFLIKTLGTLEAKSEGGQDLFACFVLSDVSNGYFVEFGAFDGVTYSNTFLLERTGWNGMLIEPIMEAFLQCQENRKARSIHGLVDPVFSGVEGSVEVIKAGLQSSHSIEASGNKSDRVDFEIIDETKRRQAKFAGNIEATPLLNLHDLLDHETERVDFISIDVEGAEALIVEGFDFNKYNVRAACVEHNWRRKDLARIEAVMAKNGFVKVLPEFSSRDAWFVQSKRFAEVSSASYVPLIHPMFRSLIERPA